MGKMRDEKKKNTLWEYDSRNEVKSRMGRKIDVKVEEMWTPQRDGNTYNYVHTYCTYTHRYIFIDI